VTPGLNFGGFPDKVRLSDWLLVEWVATATAAAKAWLETHPKPGPDPLTTTRRQQRGRPYGI
jgi:hypothetical protein